MPATTWRIKGCMLSDGGTEIPFPIDLTYNTADPYAFQFDFHVGAEEPITWMMDTWLFEYALDHPGKSVGRDAVVTYRCAAESTNDKLSLHLRTPEGSAAILLDATEMRTRVKRVQELATNDVKEAALNAMLAEFAKILGQA